MEATLTTTWRRTRWMRRTRRTSGAYIVPGAAYTCFYDSWDPWCGGYYPFPSYYGGFGLDIGFGFGGGFWGYRPYGYGYGYPRYGYGYGFG